jgi:hypothetical protein
MLGLLHSRFRDLAFTHWRTLRFLDEAVQHDDTPSDERAEKYPGNTLAPLQSQFEEPVAECSGMRFPQIWAKGDHPPGQHDVPGSEATGNSRIRAWTSAL